MITSDIHIHMRITIIHEKSKSCIIIIRPLLFNFNYKLQIVREIFGRMQLLMIIMIISTRGYSLLQVEPQLHLGYIKLARGGGGGCNLSSARTSASPYSLLILIPLLLI